MNGTGCQAAAELTTTSAPRRAATIAGQHVDAEVDHGDAVEAHHVGLAGAVELPQAPARAVPGVEDDDLGRPRRGASMASRVAASPSGVARSAARPPSCDVPWALASSSASSRSRSARRATTSSGCPRDARLSA